LSHHRLGKAFLVIENPVIKHIMDAGDKVRLNIVKIRRKKGYTQEKLAYEADVSKGYLSEIESGKKSPTVRTLQKLADTLEVPLSKLLS